MKTAKAGGKISFPDDSFQQESSLIGDDINISAIVKPSGNSFEESFDMKLLTKTVQGTLTKIDEESAECDSVMRPKSQHMSELPAGPEEPAAQNTFEAELNFSN